MHGRAAANVTRDQRFESRQFFKEKIINKLLSKSGSETNYAH